MPDYVCQRRRVQRAEPICQSIRGGGIDDRDGAYPAAIYALADGTPNSAYFGIRRFPYSRDRSKDPRTFKHIGDENPLPGALSGAGNSEVHATGEI